MKCPKCGKELADEAKVCPACNTVLSGNESLLDRVIKKSKNTKVGLAAIIAAVVVVLILIITIASGAGYKGAVRKYFKLYMKDNPKYSAYVDALYPAPIEKAYKTSYKILKKDKDLKDDMDEFGEDYMDDYFDTEYEKFGYKIIGVDKLSKNTIDDLNDSLDDWVDALDDMNYDDKDTYDALSDRLDAADYDKLSSKQIKSLTKMGVKLDKKLNKLKVKKGYYVCLKIYDKKDKDEASYTNIFVIKVGNKWVVSSFLNGYMPNNVVLPCEGAMSMKTTAAIVTEPAVTE